MEPSLEALPCELPLFDFERPIFPGEKVPLNVFKPRAIDATAAAREVFQDLIAIASKNATIGVLCRLTALKEELMQGRQVLRVIAKATYRFTVEKHTTAEDLPTNHPCKPYKNLTLITVRYIKDLKPNTVLGNMRGPAEFNRLSQQVQEAQVN